jgi:hypothetical protein
VSVLWQEIPPTLTSLTCVGHTRGKNKTADTVHPRVCFNTCSNIVPHQQTFETVGEALWHGISLSEVNMTFAPVSATYLSTVKRIHLYRVQEADVCQTNWQHLWKLPGAASS